MATASRSRAEPGVPDLTTCPSSRGKARVRPGGPPAPLTSDTGVDPKWSPDGTRIVFTRRGELHVMLRDGRDDRAIVSGRRPTSAPQYGIWSTDGKTIYFKAADAERRASIWAVPAEGGTPALMVRLDDPGAALPQARVRHRRRPVLLHDRPGRSDIWVAEVK